MDGDEKTNRSIRHEPPIPQLVPNKSIVRSDMQVSNQLTKPQKKGVLNNTRERDPSGQIT